MSGSASYLNTSYPIGLAAAVDGRRPRFAVIDVGTNSVKFHLAESAPDGGWRRIVDRAEVTRLGEGLPERGTIGPEPLARTAQAIKGDGRRGEGERSRRDRRGRDGGHAHRDEQRRRGGRDPARRGRDRRGHPGRRGSPARLPRGPGRARPRRRAHRGLRHGRRQQPVHVRPGRARRRALQRRRRRGALHGGVRPRRAPVSPDVLAAALAAIGARPRPPRRPAATRPRSSAWAARSRTSPP